MSEPIHPLDAILRATRVAPHSPAAKSVEGILVERLEELTARIAELEAELQERKG